MPTLNRRKDNTNISHTQGRNNRKIYQSARWHRLSIQFRKANPLCKRCLDKGLTEKGEVVDHVIPLIHWHGDPYDTRNMQSLSKKCHSIKTIEDRKKYGN